jgi:hypothetical protein
VTEAAPGRPRPAVVGWISLDKQREVALGHWLCAARRVVASCERFEGSKSVVDRSTTRLNSGETDGLSVDGGAGQRTGLDAMDELKHLFLPR